MQLPNGPDPGAIRQVPADEELKAYETELSAIEARTLAFVDKAARNDRLAAMRQPHPVKFSQKHRRKHR